MSAAVRPVVGFLTSVYAKQSHTFMRQEVAALRALGWDVRTFSIREPAASEVVDADARAAHEETEYLLKAGPLKIAGATLAEFARSPRRFLGALRQAVRLGTPGLKGRTWPLLYLAEGAFLARRLRALGVGHLHNHLGRNSAAVAQLAGHLAGIPHSLTVHGPTEFDEPKALALGEKVRRAAFAVAISDYGRSQLCRWARRADWGKVHVVRCGVGRAFLEAAKGPPPPPPPDVPRLVSVGRLAEQKGQHAIVEAVGLLRDRGIPCEVAIVGDGPMRGALEAAIAAARLGDRVHLLGWRDAEGVRAELLASRAMVLPSFAEGLPVVLMEALALGRPVVSTYVAGIPELVRPGREGWLVPPGSAEALAEALAECLAAPPEALARMAASGAARVAERHDPRAEAARLGALIGAANRGRRGGGPAPPGMAPGASPVV